MQSSIDVRIRHRIRGSEDRHCTTCSVNAAPRVVDLTLHMSAGVHLFLVHINGQPVTTHKVVILPGSRISGVDRYSALAMKLPPIADHVDRTLNFGKGSRAVGLLLAVISRRRFSAAKRNPVS